MSIVASLLLIAASAGCAHVDVHWKHYWHGHSLVADLSEKHDSRYYHCPHCGQIVPREGFYKCPRCLSPAAFYGYHPTCWRQFPHGWGCPPEAVTRQPHCWDQGLLDSNVIVDTPVDADHEGTSEAIPSIEAESIEAESIEAELIDPDHEWNGETLEPVESDAGAILAPPRFDAADQTEKRRFDAADPMEKRRQPIISLDTTPLVSTTMIDDELVAKRSSGVGDGATVVPADALGPLPLRRIEWTLPTAEPRQPAAVATAKLVSRKSPALLTVERAADRDEVKQEPTGTDSAATGTADALPPVNRIELPAAPSKPPAPPAPLEPADDQPAIDPQPANDALPASDDSFPAPVNRIPISE